ncbi:hypothetical protein BBP40_004840 [Aspergillus hancockii]|nr:hypothetical protein BBP40_004840 [Aspergillus hancockii]
MDYSQNTSNGDVAIVGLGYRLPGGVDDDQKLWDFCSEARCAVGPIPRARYNADGFYHPYQPKSGHFNVRGASFLEEDVATFDAPFFNISEAEAKAIDPQHRLLLECAFVALENAGIPVEEVAGQKDVGVFVGGSKSEYETYLSGDIYQESQYGATGNATCMFANRLSYFFGLRGPSQTIDTACSSSLVALHNAVESIKRGECSCSIVGGSFLQISPSVMALMSSLGALGDEGKSFSFDHRADGYGRGEGGVCIILKSLEAAKLSEDRIRAVIRNSGINHSGHSHGITNPDMTAQVQLMSQVYQSAGLDPCLTDFVECHGTGTKRGDPIEAGSVAQVFSANRTPDNPVYIGSAKSNFGHLEGASGILSVIKCVLMLERGIILPNANFEKANPNIDLHLLKLKVPTQCVPWPRRPVKRASVNNFGFGGANAHVIIDEAPVKSRGPNPASDSNMHEPCPRLYVLSAKDERALSNYIPGLIKYIANATGDEQNFMTDLSYTLRCRRSRFGRQLGMVAATPDELVQKLQEPPKIGRLSTSPRVQFVFTGQGAQWPQMGLSLMKYGAFAEKIFEAEIYLKELGARWSLIDELAKPPDLSRVGTTTISQPATTVLQVALVSLLSSWGVQPSAVCGHSSGEIAAAYAAGFLDLRSSVAVAYFRGKAAGDLQRSQKEAGAMMAVGAGADIVEPLLGSLLKGLATIACYNSPNSVTVSGDIGAINELGPILEKLGVFHRILKVDVAYHSHHMPAVGYSYLDNIATIVKKNFSTPGKTQFFSSVNGKTMNPTIVQSPWYWLANFISPVQFAISLQTMISSPDPNGGNRPVILVEIGPHDALKGPVRQTIQHPQHSEIAKMVEYVSTLKRGEIESKSILNTIASLTNSGYPVEYSAIKPSTPTPSHPLLLTDLPSYCFNKTKRYWQNSRFSDEFAHSTLPWNVLLGHNVPGSIGRSLAFRNVFKLDDVPWLRDHRINGTIIFPMTGYICMAIEAIQITFQHQSKHISGYRLREIILNKAFILSEEATHDLYIVVQPQAQSTRASNFDDWFTFQISSWDASLGFSEHCRGSIAIDPTSSQDTFDRHSIHSLREAQAEKLMSQALESIQCEATPETLYNLAELEGLQYGPAFRLLSRIRQGEGFSVGTVRCGDPRSSMPLQYHNQLVIHPAILDAVFHVGFRFRDGHDDGPESLAVSVPNFLQEAYISSDIPQQIGSEIEVIFHDYRGDVMTRTNSASATCFISGSKSPIMEFRNAKGFEIGKTDTNDSQGNMLNPLHIEWQKHPLMLAPGYLEHVISRVPPIATELQELQDLEQVSYYLIEKAISVPRLPPAKKHLRQLQSWMEQCVAQVKSSKSSSAQGQWVNLNDIERQQFIEKSCSKTILGAMIAEVGQQLGGILEGNVDPLSVLVGKGDLGILYDESYIFKCPCGHLAQIVGLLSLHNPSLRILEVGAGTGGCTARVLEELSSIPSLGHRFHSYDYTDISPGFFEAAMAKFQKYKARMSFKRFDLSQGPVEQGFTPASYDLVIASDVIHATPDISQSLRHIREVLKPDGVLATVELAQARPIMFPFATLPGWWSREAGPVVSRSEWEDLLLQSGFTGLDEAITDFPDWQNHFTFLSRVAGTSTPFIQPVTVVSDRSPPQILMKDLEHLIQRVGGQFMGRQPMSDACSGRGIFVCLDEIWEPYLATASQEQFDHFRRLICKARGILWVTKPLRRGSLDEPMLDFALGFARTLTQENAGLKFVVLQLEPDDDRVCTMNIMKVFEHAFITNPGIVETDLEYKVIGNHVHIPRIVPDNKTRGDIEQETTGQPIDGEKLWQTGRSHHLNIGYVGLLNTLHFQPHAITEDDQTLAPDEVLFEVKAAGMNFKDVLVALGSVPWEPLGKECSGVVIAAGKAARAQYNVGDSIIALGAGFLSTHVRCSVRNVSKMPRVLNYAEAASIPVVYVTAYVSLVNVAHLKRGEKILIHAAAGGVGQAAITVAQWIGAEVFCTVGTASKKNHIMDVYGIPEAHIFSSRSSLFAKGVILATASYGVDVILNSFSGEALRESWQCLAPFGRFVDIGKRSFLENAYLELAPFDKALSFHAVDLALLMSNRPDYVHRVMAEVMEHIDSGNFQLIQPIQTVPVTDIESCMRTIQSGKHIGKFVVMFNDKQALVKARRPSWEVNPIRQDASYIITGGAGGLGRSLAKWLISQGATSIILAARRGSEGVSDSKKQELRDHSEANAAKVQFVKCDVGSITDVRKLLEAVPPDKPVRGVIHGAMTLKDCTFENSVYADWEAVLRPKVSGVINLNQALTNQSLDFFICLSSTAAVIGNIGQASYSASNAVLDGFCRWRHSQDLPAGSINLPAVTGVGYVAETVLKSNDEAKKTADDDKFNWSVTEAQVHLLVKVMAASQRFRTSKDQCLIGFPFSPELASRPWAQVPLFAHFLRLCSDNRMVAGDADKIAQGPSIMERLASQTGLDAIFDVAFEAVRSKIASIMMIPEEDIAAEKSIMDLGLDSLVAVEFRNWITKQFDVSLSVVDITSSATVQQLVWVIIERSNLAQVCDSKKGST